MSDADVQHAIETELLPQNQAAAPPSSAAASSSPFADQPVTRALALGEKALVSGAASVAGWPGDVESAWNALLPRPLSEAPGGPRLPTSAATTGYVDAHLFPGLAVAEPSGKYSSAALSGAAQGAPFGPLGAGAGALGGLAGEAVHENLPGHPLLEAGAGAAAGLGLGGAQALLRGNTIERVASSLGDAKTWDDAGTALQTAARNWLTTVKPAKEAAAWAPVDAAIPASTPTPLPSYSAALASMTGKGGQLADSLKLLTQQLPVKLQAALPYSARVALPTSPQLAPTWADVRALRSSLGDAMSNPQISKDIPAQQLSQLYKAVTADLGSVATANGAGDSFAAANAVSKSANQFAEGTLSKLVADAKGGADAAPGKVAKALVTAGNTTGADLAALRAELPEAMDSLAAAHLRISPASWAKLSPGAKEALVPDQASRSLLEANTAGAAPNSKIDAMGDTLKMLLGENVLGAVTEHLGLPGGEVGGKIAGAVLPLAFRGAKNLVQNPSAVRLPLAGALGTNALNGGS